MMRTLVLVAAVVQAVLGGGSQFAVRLPFLNPAGVTYVNGPAPVGLAAGPALGYAATAPALGLAAGPAVGYAASGPALGLAAGPALGYAASGPALGLAAGPAVGYAATAPALGYAAAAPAVGLAAAPAVGYAAAAPAAVGYAAVPTVHHVPGVADVPVTRLEAQPGVIQKLVDVAKPAVQTRRFEVRRPAIQKQFYDVEERVVVRPAGSALVELEEPLLQRQRGPAVISPAAPAALAVGAAGIAAAPIAQAPFVVGPTPVAQAPVVVGATPSPVFVSTTPAPAFDYPSPGPSPSGPPSFADQGPAIADSDDSVVIDAEFAARSRAQAQSQAQAQAQAQARAQAQAAADAQARYQSTYQSTPAPRILPAAPPAPRLLPSPGPAVQLRSSAGSYDGLIPVPRASGEVIASQRDHIPHEVSQANQQRLIQLLTARGGIAEVGFGRSGPAEAPVGDAGITRARVLSATPAPEGAAPAGERVQTRRVVVSRPIETVQEFDVVEPVTKLERVAVHHPTVFKTLRQDVARVPTSFPVLGKAFAPAVGFYH